MHRSVVNKLSLVLVAIGILIPIATAPAAGPDHLPPGHGKKLDLERLTGPEALAMMERGELTSVELVKAYLDRIEALNKRGPGLNAVTQLNEDALEQAKQLDEERRAGHLRSPAHGLPS